MAKRPSAKWVGVIRFPQLQLEINGGFYSSMRRGRAPLPLVRIHLSCQTRLAEAREEKEEPSDAETSEEAAEPIQVAHVLYCPTCRRALRADEIGRAVETQLGLLHITDEEYEGLKVKRAKVIEARIVEDPTTLLLSVGMGRRFWLLPKADSVEAYYTLIHVFRNAQSAGFVQEIVIDRRPYTVVVRPIVTHASVFGEEIAALSADEFVDTDLLRSPKEYQLLPSVPPSVDSKHVAALIVTAQDAAATVDPASCINPQRRKFDALVRQKIAARKVI